MAIAEPLQTFDRVHFFLWGRRRASGNQGADWSVQPLTPGVWRSLPEIPWKTVKTAQTYVLVAQSCLNLCNPSGCSPPGSFVHGIHQARILEWVAIPFSWDLPNPGLKPGSPTLQADSLLSEPPGKPQTWGIAIYWKKQTPSRNVQRINSTGMWGGFDRLGNSFANHLDKWHHLEENLPNRVQMPEPFWEGLCNSGSFLPFFRNVLGDIVPDIVYYLGYRSNYPVFSCEILLED